MHNVETTDSSGGKTFLILLLIAIIIAAIVLAIWFFIKHRKSTGIPNQPGQSGTPPVPPIGGLSPPPAGGFAPVIPINPSEPPSMRAPTRPPDRHPNRHPNRQPSRPPTYPPPTYPPPTYPPPTYPPPSNPPPTYPPPPVPPPPVPPPPVPPVPPPPVPPPPSVPPPPIPPPVPPPPVPPPPVPPPPVPPPPVPPPPPTCGIPSWGSYLSSCTNAQTIGSTLVAACQTGASTCGTGGFGFDYGNSPCYQLSTIDLATCSNSQPITNSNGVLGCTTGSQWNYCPEIPLQSCPLPSSSKDTYQTSCTDAQMIGNVLFAVCEQNDTSLALSYLDLNTCGWGGVQNQNGVLTCPSGSGLCG